MTVSPVHVGLDSAAAPKIKTKTAPAQPFKALLHLDEATTTRARPRALTQPTAQPTAQPLVFLPKTFTRAAPPADEVAAKLSKGKSATARSATQRRGLHFVLSDSDDLYDQDHGPAVRQHLRQGSSGVPGRQAAQGENLHAARGPTPARTRHPAHVTKTAHETKLEIVTEPFVPTPEEASPPKIVKQP